MAKKGHTRGRKEPRRPSALGWALKWLFVAAIWGGIAGLGVVAWYAYDLPDVSRLGEQSRTPSVTLAAADGSTIARFGDLYGPAVLIEHLPTHLKHAVLATEDRRFYEHFGLDPVALVRAGMANLRAGRIVQGGSTLTQPSCAAASSSGSFNMTPTTRLRCPRCACARRSAPRWRGWILTAATPRCGKWC